MRRAPGRPYSDISTSNFFICFYVHPRPPPITHRNQTKSKQNKRHKSKKSGDCDNTTEVTTLLQQFIKKKRKNLCVPTIYQKNNNNTSYKTPFKTALIQSPHQTLPLVHKTPFLKVFFSPLSPPFPFSPLIRLYKRG